MAITAAHIAVYQMPTLSGLNAGDQHDSLTNIISDAQQQEVFPSLQQTGKSTFMHESMIAVIRTRLFLLGYLEKNNESSQWDDELAEGMHEFQEDSHLSKTERLDEATWSALQQMVSFEHEIEVERWYVDGRPVPALLRAIGLRLFVFGLLDKKMAPQGRKLKRQGKLEDRDKRKKLEKLQEKIDNAIQEGLDHFAELSFFIGLSDNHLPTSGSFSFPQLTVQALFDQDRILSGISNAWNGHSFNIDRPSSFDANQTNERVHDFIICCAKVELWLHGYEVKPDGTAAYKMPNEGFYQINSQAFPVFDALCSFWKDCGLNDREAWTKAERIEGDFFQQVSNIQEEGQHVALESPSDEVFNTIVQEEPTVIDKIWSDIKSIGSRIWDGLKRAWNWFKNLLKKAGQAIKKVAAWATNLARLAYKYAMNAFPAVRQIITSVSASIQAILNPIYPGSDPKVMVIQHDKDFDFTVVINPNSSVEQQNALLRGFQYNTILVRFGFQIMGLLIGTIIDLVKKIVTAGGWFGLILALVKGFSRLRELRVVLEDERVLLGEI